MKKPLVSIILPTYNRKHVIKKAVESVLNQTYRTFELIIIDDGSKDGTYNFIKNFSDKRIKIIKLNKNCGQSHARNIGIKRSKGEFIAFQDSDDFWHKNKLEEQIQYFLDSKDPKLGVVYCLFERIIGPSKRVLFPKPNLKKLEGDIHKILLNTAMIGLPTAVIKKECLDKLGGFDESMPALEDQDLFLRLSKQYHFGFINKILFTAYGKDNLSDDPKRIIPAIKKFIQNHYNDLSFDKKNLNKQYAKIADAYVRENNPLMAKKFFYKIIKNGNISLRYAIGAGIFLLFGSNFYLKIRSLK